VNIYGRINRIRPWESGINYYALVRYLDQETTQWRMQSRYAPWLYKQVPISIDARTQPADAVLAITREEDCLERLASYPELASIEPRNVTVIDAAMPIMPYQLCQALIADYGTNWPVIRFRYLFLDRGVRDGLDRRTFKDHDFWYGAEMTRMLAEYESQGGVIIYGDSSSDS